MKKIKLDRNVILSVLLFLGIVFSIFQIVRAAPPNPGHGWVDVGDNSGDALPANRGGTGQTTLTNNSVLVGNGTDVVKYVAPGTSGNLLTSNGTTWLSTALSGLTVAQGGTGQTTFVANSVLLGNVAGAIANVAPGTSGNVLTSNGTTWASAAAAGGLSSGALLLRTVAAANGTLTTTANTGNILIQLVGAGGGGAGSTGSANNGMVGAGGGSGGYTEAFLVVSPSTGYAYNIGAGGTAVANAAGGTGGTSYIVVGANNVTAIGGNGGAKMAAANNAAFIIPLGGNGGAAGAVGNLLTAGTAGGYGMFMNRNAMVSGWGAPSYFGGGARSVSVNATATGNNGINCSGYGGGGSGSGSGNNNTTNRVGGTGCPGVIIIWQYK